LKETVNMLGLDNPIHLVFLLLLLLMVFGAKRLPEMGRSLGSGLRGFKDSLSGEGSTHSLTEDQTEQLVQAPVQPAAQPVVQPVPVQAPLAVATTADDTDHTPAA
jgi:sec-independent protein translocase protein TatA